MRLTKPLFIHIPIAGGSSIHRALHSSDGTFFGHIIQHCTHRRLIRQAKQLHARLILAIVEPDTFIASKLISFYSKCNHLSDAQKVFDQTRHRNTFTWNALLIGFSLHNKHDETLRLFSAFMSSPVFGETGLTLPKPDNYTLTCVLKALSSFSQQSYLARIIHSYIIRNGFDSDIFVFNALITYYSRCHDIVLARSLFDSNSGRDIVSWNSMIAAYSQRGFYAEAKSLFKEMLALQDLMPNKFTVASVLHACAQSNDLVFGMEVHQFFIENNIEMDLSMCNSIISLYAKCGNLEYATDFFKGMNEKDEITYNSMISAYMVHGFADEATKLFREMRNPGLSTWNSVISGLVQNNKHEEALGIFRVMQADGFRPNAVSLSIVLPILTYFSNLKGAKEVHACAIRHNYDKDVYVSTGIMDIYAKMGYLAGAQRIFDRLKDRSVIVWTAIISAYASHGDANTALNLLDEMLTSCTQPDPITFTAALSACAHSGKVEKAWEIFNSMQEYNISPLVEHYACMVSVLGRAGKLYEAVEFVTTMPMEPSGKLWGALLNGASISGNVELGEFACERLFKIEPENTGNYITMANLYNRAGRWEEAEIIRQKMQNLGTQKIAGSSWIETAGGVKSFKARDLMNQKADEMCQILEGLLELMREEGYTWVDEFDEESLSLTS